MNMNSEPATPPRSRTSSQSSRGRRSPPLSIDLSDLPPLVQPSPPSNTLLITNLNDPTIFAPATLAHIRQLILQHSPHGIHTFAPLRSLRRIIVSFPTVDSAVAIRSLLDGESLFGHRIRIYFGEPTSTDEISEKERHLQAPKASKQFFISPPPSPPHGWEMRDEEPPNKDVHADDLVSALEKLSARKEDSSPMEGVISTGTSGSRHRSGSTTIVYRPEEHGNSPGLPAIAVEDLTGSPGDWTPEEEEEEVAKMPMIHTSRPPVELMTDA